VPLRPGAPVSISTLTITIKKHNLDHSHRNNAFRPRWVIWWTRHWWECL